MLKDSMEVTQDIKNLVNLLKVPKVYIFFSLCKRCSKENTYGKPTVKKQGCFGSGTRIYFSQLLQRDKATLFYFFGFGLKHSFFNF